MGNSNFGVGQVLIADGEFTLARAEPFLQVVTGGKIFVISNDREKSQVWVFKRKATTRSLPMVEMTNYSI